MKQMRISNLNEVRLNRLIRDAHLEYLTISKAGNMAIDKGEPLLRKLLVKPNRKSAKPKSYAKI